MFKFYLVFPILTLLLITTAFAQTNSMGFMTARDVLHSDSPSNIYLQNNRGSTVTVYGLYVRQYASVEPGQNCTAPEVMYSGVGNITAGAFVAPVAINAGKRVAIGSNYLYNMLYTANYYIQITIPSSPPGCQLPGCTWGSDMHTYNWCIYLGALAPNSNSSDYTASVPPAADAASGVGYNYNLISSYGYLGPISCDDQTLTCTVETQQTQAFS